jgi:hypothetical protein
VLHLRSLHTYWVAAYFKATNHCRIFVERYGNMECRVVRSKWQLHVKFTYNFSVSFVSESYITRPPTETVSIVGIKRMYVFLLLSGHCEEVLERNRLSCNTAAVPGTGIRTHLRHLYYLFILLPWVSLTFQNQIWRNILHPKLRVSSYITFFWKNFHNSLKNQEFFQVRWMFLNYRLWNGILRHHHGHRQWTVFVLW